MGLVVGVGLLVWVWLDLCCGVGLVVGLCCCRGCSGWFVLPTWVWLDLYFGGFGG